MPFQTGALCSDFRWYGRDRGQWYLCLATLEIVDDFLVHPVACPLSQILL